MTVALINAAKRKERAGGRAGERASYKRRLQLSGKWLPGNLFLAILSYFPRTESLAQATRRSNWCAAGQNRSFRACRRLTASFLSYRL